MTDTVLWLGGASALKELAAAEYRLVDAPQDGQFAIVAAGARTSEALALALARPKDVTSVVLLAPDLFDAAGFPRDAALAARFAAIEPPLLALFGTTDSAASPDCARHYRAKNPRCSVVFIYDAGAAMADERPEAVAELVLDFLKRGEKFLVRQSDDRLYR